MNIFPIHQFMKGEFKDNNHDTKWDNKIYTKYMKTSDFREEKQTSSRKGNNLHRRTYPKASRKAVNLELRT